MRFLLLSAVLAGCAFDAAVEFESDGSPAQRDASSPGFDGSSPAIDANQPLVPLGLVGHWSFDSVVMNQVDDHSVSANHGDVRGALEITGVSGAALSFDGVDDYVALGNPASLDFTGAISVSAWIQPAQGDRLQNIVAHGYTPNPAGGYFFRVYDGMYQAGSWDGGDHKASAAIPDQDPGSASWIHLVSTFDGVAWRLYRNGIEIDVGDSSPGAVTVQEDWAIGARGTGTGRFFAGGIDEVRIYDRALSEAEILMLAGQ